MKSLTPAKIALIADCLFDGLTDEETALFCDLSDKTVQRMRLGEECPAIKKAELMRKRLYISKIRDGTMRDWTRIAWFLERRYPKEFSRPEIQLGYINNNTFNQNYLQINISTSEAKEIEQKAGPIRDAVRARFAQYKPLQGNGNNDDVSTA